jgi:hypothetical protein
MIFFSFIKHKNIPNRTNRCGKETGGNKHLLLWSLIEFVLFFSSAAWQQAQRPGLHPGLQHLPGDRQQPRWKHQERPRRQASLLQCDQIRRNLAIREKKLYRKSFRVQRNKN